MRSNGRSTIKVLFELQDNATTVTVWLRMHESGETKIKQKDFPPTMSASEIIRMHMDYTDEWSDEGHK